MKKRDEKESGPSEFAAAHGVVNQETGQPVPKPDPKDQTGDPEVDDNPAMEELRKRQARRGITES